MHKPSKTRQRRTILGTTAGVVAMVLGCMAPAHAESFPSSRITLVVAFPAGGTNDAVARYLADPLAKRLGQPVVVENVGGAAGAIGAAQVKRAQADGYTLLLGSVNETVLAPITNAAVKYSYKDFTPVAKVGSTAFVVVGRKDLPASSIDDVLRLAREKPGTLTFGSTGVGSYQQVVMESIQRIAGVSMVHVPYRGGGPMLTDLLGSQIDLAVSLPTTMLPQINRQSVKAFGVTGQKRDPAAPDLPSVNEGKVIKGVDFVFWFGVFAPNGLQDERRTQLQEAVTDVLKDEQVRKQLEAAGLTVATQSEQQTLPAFIAEEDAKLRAAAQGINF
ncbi:hypothetical protein LMG26684_02063 [Achromobacter mucicolens]|uniref:Bug family tripartite tricarboxylate transporter substrate binding protein n=1 Tax=Achromobacter mucicolens TaxID=1389922 RepID=UPI0014670153|nr:tripartite tricarboxylate transporter substrate binding protein [Achromobacter mucicolens]CAB3850727.1 hypothetical protein LMG26684_02063 [Achromobacter mucicolens]